MQVQATTSTELGGITLRESPGGLGGGPPALRHIPEPEVIEMRRMHFERTEAMINALWADAMAGKVAAIRGLRSVLERQARLLGCDPTRPMRSFNALSDSGG